MPELFKGIKAIIIGMGINVYTNDVVFAAFQNNLTLPTDNTFAVITELDTISQAMMPAWGYDPDTETEEYDNLDSTWFQVDFYGSSAKTAANKFKLLLQSATGSNFLDAYNCNVHEVKDMINLTGVLDREQYTKRYAVKFSLFSNNSLTIDSLGFESDDPNIRLAEVQT